MNNTYRFVIGHTVYKDTIYDNLKSWKMSYIETKFLCAIEIKLVSIQATLL